MLDALIAGVGDHEAIINAAFSIEITAERKEKIWRRITDNVNAENNGDIRTCKEVRIPSYLSVSTIPHVLTA